MSAPAAVPTLAPKRQYLVTDDGFVRSLTLNLVVISAIVGAVLHIQPLYEVGFELYGWLSEQMMHAAHRMAWWSLLGLLSSSCCALQILLNAFSFGCAGFNTTLGPLRPTFVALTLTIQGLAWYVAYPRPWQWAPTAASTALATVLTLLPEALALHTAWRQRPVQCGVGQAFQLQLSTLGCVACVSKVSGVLDGITGVTSYSVSLETGLATVHLEPSAAEGDGTKKQHEIRAVVVAAGFPAVIAGEDTQPECCSTTDAAEENEDAADWAQRNSTVSAVVAGLLSSSCCLLQLGINGLAVLNVAHIGCAGFNKVLGPWRSQLRCVTLAWLGMMWAISFRRRWPKLPLLCSTLLALGLSWLPEILLALGSGGGSFAMLSGVAPSYEGAELLQLKVNGMGCEACQLHVRTTLEMSAGVLSSRVDWEGGTAAVWVNSAWGFNLTDLSARLEYDGYEITADAGTVAQSVSVNEEHRGEL